MIFAKEDTPCLLCGGTIRKGELMEEFDDGWHHASDDDFFIFSEDTTKPRVDFPLQDGYGRRLLWDLK